MVVDLYTKREGEIRYSETQFDETDPIRIYVQKIKMILFTQPGEIVGNPGFGVNLERLLFQKSLSAQSIRNNIINQIGYNCEEFNDYETNVEVTFYSVGGHDECKIDILINNLNVLSLKTF